MRGPCVDAVALAASVQDQVAALREAVRTGVVEVPARDADRDEPDGVHPASTGAGLVDLASGLAQLVAAAEACSARVAVELDRVRRQQEAERGVPAARRGAGVAAEIGLARRESVHRAGVLLGFAKALCTEMPHTLARLSHGDLTTWRAMLLVKESACLEREERERLDAELCTDPRTLSDKGDRAVVGAAREWCCREAPASVVERRSRAESQRRVSLRPAPDTMAYLTALLPVAQGVAAYKALEDRAGAARATGDERSRGQVMADALVAGVTGRQEGEPPDVLVNLVMTDASLFRGDREPGLLPGYGPVPAASAREMVARSARDAGAFVRRLYRAPSSGALVATDARTRRAPTGLADLVALRDGGTCRMPWCDAPVRHTDHVVPHANGGATDETNLQGLCETHNYAKQAPGWRAVGAEGDEVPVERGAGRAPEGARHRVVTTTPSGHAYSSTAPPLPGTPRRVCDASGPRPSSTDPPSPLEGLLNDLLERGAA